MNIKELIEKYTPMVTDTGMFALVNITTINHKPHMFMIGPRHIGHASKYHGGMLGDATLEAIPCAYRGCSAHHSEHVHDTVMVLKLVRDTIETEAEKELQLVVLGGMTEDGMDGFVFQKSEFNFTKD